MLTQSSPWYKSWKAFVLRLRKKSTVKFSIFTTTKNLIADLNFLLVITAKTTTPKVVTEASQTPQITSQGNTGIEIIFIE